MPHDPRPKLSDFTAPRFTASNLDRFLARAAVLRGLKQALPHFSGTLLDVGCGYMPYKAVVLNPPSRATAYIGLDMPPSETYNNSPDVVWNGREIPLPDNAVDCAMATEVLEHCPEPESVLREVARVLKPGGPLFFSVPFLWPIHDAPHDEYRYTPFSLRRHFENAGYQQVEIAPTGGWDASLAQMLGLWVRRRPMLRINRNVLSLLAKPLVWLLARMDKLPSLDAATMITGLSGTARKRG